MLAQMAPGVCLPLVLAVTLGVSSAALLLEGSPPLGENLTASRAGQPPGANPARLSILSTPVDTVV